MNIKNLVYVICKLVYLVNNTYETFCSTNKKLVLDLVSERYTKTEMGNFKGN